MMATAATADCEGHTQRDVRFSFEAVEAASSRTGSVRGVAGRRRCNEERFRRHAGRKPCCAVGMSSLPPAWIRACFSAGFMPKTASETMQGLGACWAIAVERASRRFVAIGHVNWRRAASSGLTDGGRSWRRR